MFSGTPRRRSLQAWSATASLLVPVVLAGCQDSPLPLQPVADPSAAASAVPTATTRTARGDLITGDAAAFAAALKEIGRDGEVLVWIRETGTPRPAPEFFLELPSSGKEMIALPADAPGAQRRRTVGPPSVRGAAVDAVVRALGKAGVESVERMSALPVMVVRLSEDVRLGALQALLRHPNVDYVSAVRARPIQFTAAPVGTNPIDAKHTVHKIPQAWDLTRGSGAKIGVLDSGLTQAYYSVAFHEDAQYFGSYGILGRGFVDDLGGNPNAGGSTAYDDHGHGTAMVGLVASNDNGTGYVGIAPLATTYSMKIAWNTHINGHCGDNVFGNDSYCLEDDDFVRAVNYAATNRMHVLSMSFTGDQNSDVYRALSTARNSYGVFLVAATGNTVGGSAKEPASFDVVMGIAGVDAAGNNMYSTAARDVSGFAGGGTMGAYCSNQTICHDGSPSVYTTTGGTSAATANVAAIVGLVRSYHPNESVSEIWNRLTLTAEGPNRVVNAYAAITYQRPLSASISGTSNTYPGAYETWTAGGTGGTAPYSYSWYRDGAFVGSGSTYSGYVNYGSFQLQVNVTDAAGGTASSWMWVTGQEPMCGDYYC